MADETTPQLDGDNGNQGQQSAQPTQPQTGNAPGKQSGQIVFESESDLQKELDRRLGYRLAKEKEKHADYDQLKAAAAELAKIKESQLSETEKLTKRLAELEAAKTQAETRARETLIRSAVISEAAKLGFNDPEDAYHLIDVSGLTIADNGKVEGADTAVKALAESRKYLIKNNNPALAAFNPAGGGGPQAETDAQRRARIYGGGGNYFDPAQAEQKGGGVVLPKGVWPEQS